MRIGSLRVPVLLLALPPALLGLYAHGADALDRNSAGGRANYWESSAPSASGVDRDRVRRPLDTDHYLRWHFEAVEQLRSGRAKPAPRRLGAAA